MAVSEESLKKTAQFDYILHIVCMVFSLGTLTILPVILNYIRRGDADGTIYRSHFDYMIRAFWKWVVLMIILGVIYFVLGVVTITIGFWLLAPIFFIAHGIFLYRMIKGLMRLSDGVAIAS